MNHLIEPMLRPLSRFAEHSQRQACRNAMVASTALARVPGPGMFQASSGSSRIELTPVARNGSSPGLALPQMPNTLSASTAQTITASAGGGVGGV